MKRILLVVFGLVFLFLMGWIGYYFYSKTKTAETIQYQTELPRKRTIENTVIMTGIIQPLKEVEVKPKITGVLEELFVKEGDQVTTGQLLGKIRLISNPVNVNAAEFDLNQAVIALNDAERQLSRQQSLFNDKVISQQELEGFQLSYNLKKQQVEGLRNYLKLLNTGARSSTKGNNQIYANTNGTIVHMPVKPGSTVIESNNFNAGTTIATIADMNQLVFEGKLDEAEVGKIRVGIPANLKIGALNNQQFSCTIDFISPQGSMENGIVKFTVRASLPPEISSGIRSGYSATAEAILDRKENVLSLPEKVLQFEEGKTFVEVKQPNGSFKKQWITTGISDGLSIEVFGLKETDPVKVIE